MMTAPHSGSRAVAPSSRRDPVFWDPFSELDRFMRHTMLDFPRVLGPSGFGGPLSLTTHTASSFMKIDIKENDSAYEIAADVPGATKENVSVELGPDNLLHLSAKTTKESAEDGDRDGWTFHREERSSEQRSRAVRLPPSVDTARLSAKVADGVLRVTLPKLPATPAGAGGRTSIPVE